MAVVPGLSYEYCPFDFLHFVSLCITRRKPVMRTIVCQQCILLTNGFYHTVIRLFFHFFERLQSLFNLFYSNSNTSVPLLSLPSKEYLGLKDEPLH